MLKLSGVLFFVLFVFIYSSSAQTIEKVNLQEDAESPLAAEIFAKFSKQRAFNALLDKKIDKDAPQTNEYGLLRGEKQIGFELAFSPFQPTFLSGRKEYDTSGRKFGMINLRWARVIGTAKGITYEYQIQITPIALAFRNEVANRAYVSPQVTPNESPTYRETTYGWGFSPLGFRFLFLPKKRLKPYLDAHGGLMFFNNPVPVPNANAYAFSGDFGGGVMYQIRRNKAINAGYRYYHLSNMNTGAINPGYNANIFYVGYSFFYK